MAHGVIARPTQDVDCFTDRERGVRRARDVVERALVKAGFGLERVDLFGGLAEVFDGVEDQMAEWIVTAPDGRQTMLQMGFFARSRGPVGMDVGPVLALEDALGSKVCAILGRSEVRDYADVAAALRRFSVDQLLGFASRLDPAVVNVKDVVAVGRRLDRLDDGVFARYGLSRSDISTIRARFRSWPRSLPVGVSSWFPCPTPPLNSPDSLSPHSSVGLRAAEINQQPGLGTGNGVSSPQPGWLVRASRCRTDVTTAADRPLPAGLGDR
jgi:hypothetical protein